jgi:hypothetical protein
MRWRRVSCILAVAVAVAVAPFLGCQREGNATSTSSAVQPSGAPGPTVAEAQPPMAFLDTPAEGGVASATARVVGWALDSSGIAQVTAAVDGQNPSSAAIGLAHPGVAEAHPGIPGNDRAGFAIEISGLQKGPHSLTVTIVAKSGGKTEIHRRFEVQ